MPKLSVLLPVRNGEKTIRQAVSSTLRSMPADAELVVLDDASTDATAQVVGRISDPRLHLISHPTGLGIARGLNHLLAQTDSEWVARMDGDDYTLPWRLTQQMRAVEHHQLDGCFSSIIDLLDRPPGLRPHLTPGISPRAFALHLLIANPVSHPTALLRRRSLETLDGYREVPAEDYDLWLRMCLGGFRLAKLRMPTLLYRIHTAQITADAEWRQASWTNESVNRCYEELSLAVCGRSLPRLVTLLAKNSDPAQAHATLETSCRSIIKAAEGLPTDESRLVVHRLRVRAAFIRKELAARPHSTDGD